MDLLSLRYFFVPDTVLRLPSPSNADRRVGSRPEGVSMAIATRNAVVASNLLERVTNAPHYVE